MKWALVGASDIASTRVIPALRLAGHDIYGVMSSNVLRARDFAAAHDLPSHTDSLKDVLAWPVDAVYISTTNERHADEVVSIAGARKHILCEKPLALSILDATRMVRAAENHQVVLATNHHLRAAGTHEMIHKIVASGDLGEIHHVRIAHAVGLSERLRTWRIAGDRPGAGVQWDILVHNIDTLRADIQSNPLEVSAFASTTSFAHPGVIDLSVCSVRLENGALATTSESYATPYGRTSLDIYGSRGLLTAFDVMRQDPIGEILITTSEGQQAIEVADRENLYVKTLRRFTEACSGHGTPYCTGDDGRWAVATVVAAERSARERRQVTLAEVWNELPPSQ